MLLNSCKIYYGTTILLMHFQIFAIDLVDLILIFDVLMPLSAIFQLYHGDQFQWWKKPEYPERTTDHRKATGKLYHLRLRVECTLFVITKPGANPHSIAGPDINVCPIPVKTDVEQVDLVLRLSNGTSEKISDSQTCRYDGQIYFHWHKILGLLYKRALFDLQFVHNLF